MRLSYFKWWMQFSITSLQSISEYCAEQIQECPADAWKLLQKANLAILAM